MKPTKTQVKRRPREMPKLVFRDAVSYRNISHLSDSLNSLIASLTISEKLQKEQFWTVTISNLNISEHRETASLLFPTPSFPRSHYFLSFVTHNVLKKKFEKN